SFWMVTLKAHILPHHDLQPPGCRGSVISEHIFSVSSGLVFTVISRQTLLCKGSTAIHRRMETRLFFQ
ncbi:hypothetical protein, partial [Escherichia coli]|uniref:hypothetical protein n=1 Tax=Escherichia coli TaxID=562 RepID=UPI001BFCB661